MVPDWAAAPAAKSTKLKTIAKIRVVNTINTPDRNKVMISPIAARGLRKKQLRNIQYRKLTFIYAGRGSLLFKEPAARELLKLDFNYTLY
jgi:hypothetical protein